MDTREMIKQTAAAAEDFLTFSQDCNTDLLNDLKRLAALFPVDRWEPATLASLMADKAIITYGPNGEQTPEAIESSFSSLDFKCLQEWVGYTFNDGELLLLDTILTASMEFAECKK